MKSSNKKVLSIFFLFLINVSLIGGFILADNSLNHSNPSIITNQLDQYPESDQFGSLGVDSYKRMGKTQVNLTCALNGTANGDKNGFSIQVNRWNSTYINMTVSKVTQYKYLYPIEEDIGGGTFAYPVNTQKWVMGFNLTDSCQLDAVDFRYSNTFTITPTAYTSVIIYNSTYSVEKGNSIPDRIIYNRNESGLPVVFYPLSGWVSSSAAPYWNGTLKVKANLDITKTYKGTFFIRFTTNTTLNWLYVNDATEGDQGLVYQGFGVSSWQNATTDTTLRLKLSPTQNEKKPSDINMTINTKPVTYAGKWNTSNFMIAPPSGLIPFQVSCSWYNVSYRVNWTARLQNITSALTLVSAQLLNKVVSWNVTMFANFVANSVNRRINVTIPVTWNTSNVFRGISLYLNWVEIPRILKKSVVIQGASTGAWVVQCKGYNWISNLSTYKQTSPAQTFYIFDTAKIVARLIRPVNDGVNNAKLNITNSNQTLLGTQEGRGSGLFINITWNIAQNIRTNGRYRLIVSWFNGTEAGIYNTTISIYNATSLVIMSPDHKGSIIEMARGELFNLTLYYNMSVWKGGWSTLYLNGSMGAKMTYSFMGAAPQPMANIFIGAWAWTTILNSPVTYGSYRILINASAWQSVQNYTNFEITLKVRQYGTKLIFNDTAKETFWKTPIAFKFTYTNLTGHPIENGNISMDWKYDADSGYRGTLIRNFNYSIYYNAGIGAYTVVFANFSAHKYNLLFYIEANIYQSQEAYLTLIYTNITTSLINQTSVQRLVYKQSGVVNVTVYYKDLVNNIGIPGAAIQSNWSLIKNYAIQDLTMGYYKVILNISKVFLNNYSVLVSASKTNYLTANLVIRLEIYGYPTTITNINGANLTGFYAKIYAKDNWTIRFNYINVTNGKGISGATITANFGGHSCVWQNLISGNYTIWADSTKLNAPMADQNYTLQIQIRKSFYEQQTLTIIINIRKLPTQILPFQSLINARIDDFIEVRVRLNDTRNHQGVNGIVWYKLQSTTKQMQPTGTVGIYSATLNLTNYVPGIYQIQFNSWALDHQNTTSIITLNVSRLNVVIIAESTTLSGYINDLLNMTIQLKDSKNRIVENLIVTYKIEVLSIEDVFIYHGNGFYNATINLAGFSTIAYQLKIESPLTSRYNNSRIILTLTVNKMPTIIIPSSLNITGYSGDQYILNARYMETVHNTYINSATLRFQIVGKTSPTIMAFMGTGVYQSTLNFTAIGVGDYKIKLNVSSSVLYQAYNISLDLHIRAKIQTRLLLSNPTPEIEEGGIINVTVKLQTVSSFVLRDKPIEWTTSVKFNNGSIILVQQIKYTDNSGIVIFQYRVSSGASSIDILAKFAGSTNLTDVWNTTSINVLKISYNLIIRVQSNIKVNELLIIRADLSNITHPIGNAQVNFTIIVVYSGEVTNETQMWGFTATNGTVVVVYTVPSDVISIYIVATYKSHQGAITSSDPKVVVAIDTWLIELGKWLPIIFLIVIIVMAIIFGVAAYYKVVRPRFTSIEDRKRQLVQKRAENRREIAQITGDIQQQREEALKEADVAVQVMDFDKAAKSYEKAGNFTLELADKAVAKEFFSKAKQMQEKSQQKERQGELKEQREKLLEAARVAIRERNVVEASRNYRQVAEMSRMLGEREQAEKFLKLANVANERIIALKEGDMRKKSGVFLSKADKSMGKQDFLGAADNFEEAAKIMLMLGDEEGTLRFVNWAKLARERQSLATAKSRDDWVQALTQEQADLIHKAKDFIRERKYDDAVKSYTTLTIYAMELGKSDLTEKYKKDADFYRKQAAQVEISPESRDLIEERRKLLLNVEDAIKNNRYAVAAKYYNRIATITEIVEGKEVARNYLKQATYYASKGQEKRLKEKEEGEKVRPIDRMPVARVSEEAGEDLGKSKAELAVTVKQARDALKTGKPVLARDLYEKAATKAETIEDRDSALRYKQKAEEIEIVKPKKIIEDEGTIRRKLTDLTAKAEKALQKKKYAEAKNLYEEISELFLQIGEEDAANSFLERASSLKRLI